MPSSAFAGTIRIPCLRFLSSSAAALALVSCSTSAPESEKSTALAGRASRADATASLPAASDSLGRGVDALARTRVYFGHQSVGNEIVAGIELLRREQPSLRFNLVQTRELGVLSGPAFVHFLVGRNEDPDSKNADFLRVLDGRPAPDHGIVLLKYCFVDVDGPQDARAIFDGYRRLVDSIHARHPDVTVVHVTMPLATVESPLRTMVKQWIGRRSKRAEARQRQAYNDLLRATYGAREPIFDLAEIESTRPDGSREFFLADGDTVFTMVPEYTYDGGHLNAIGRRRAAVGLLGLLDRVAARTLAASDVH